MKSKNDVESTKNTLIKHFKRREARLHIKKQRTVARYSTHANSLLAGVSTDKLLRSRLNLIDAELVALERRIERLKLEDNFAEGLFNQD
jgi:hypothetical protein